MTLMELRQHLAMYLGRDSTSSDGLLQAHDLPALNLAALEIANRLRIPRGEMTVDRDAIASANYTIALPTGAIYPVQVMAPPGQPVPVLDSEDVIWEDDKLYVQDLWTPLIMVPRANPTTLQVRPRNKDWLPKLLRITYQKAFTPMQVDTDRPWENQYEAWHYLIAVRAAMQLASSIAEGVPEAGLADLRARLQYLADAFNRGMETLSETVDRTVPARANLQLPVVLRVGRWSRL